MDDESIKKEVYTNGPVIAQINVFTDFLTYKSGLYHRTEESQKLSGNQMIKIIGWEKKEMGAGEYWIVENAWGEDWGENGLAYVWMGDSNLGISAAVAPTPMPSNFGDYEKAIEAGEESVDPKVEMIEAEPEEQNVGKINPIYFFRGSRHGVKVLNKILKLFQVRVMQQ